MRRRLERAVVCHPSRRGGGETIDGTRAESWDPGLQLSHADFGGLAWKSLYSL